MFGRNAGLNRAVSSLRNLVQRRSKVNPMVFSMVMDGLCKAGQEGAAISLFEQAVAASSVAEVDRSQVFSSLVCGVFRRGKLERVSSMVRQLIQGGLILMPAGFAFPGGSRALLVNDVMDMLKAMGVLNTFAFNCLIEGLCKGGRLEDAQEVYRVMQQAKVPADVFTYSFFIDGICKAGNLDEAEKLLEFMECSSCKPDVVAYTNLLHGFCEAGLHHRAYSVLQRMSKAGCIPDVVTYNSFISGLCRVRDFDGAVEVVSQMIEAGCEPNEITYSTIIDVLCKEEMWAQALQVFETMRKRKCRASVDVYGRLINCLCKVGDTESALLLLRELEETDQTSSSSSSSLLLGGERCAPNLIIYSTVISGLCDKSRMEEAEMVLKLLKARGLTADVVTYTSLIRGCCKSGRLDEARSLLTVTMVDAGCTPDATAYNTLMLGLRYAGHEEEACSMLEVMVRAGCEPDETSFRIVIETLCKRRKYGPAVELLQLLRETIGSSSPDMATFKLLVYGLYQAGRVDDARSLLLRESKAFSEMNPGLSLASELHQVSNPSEQKWLETIIRAGL